MPRAPAESEMVSRHMYIVTAARADTVLYLLAVLSLALMPLFRLRLVSLCPLSPCLLPAYSVMRRSGLTRSTSSRELAKTGRNAVRVRRPLCPCVKQSVRAAASAA